MTSHHFISWDIYPPFYSNISRSHQHCSSKITKMFFNKICHFNSHLREITLISVTKKLRFKFGKISVRKENKTHKQAQWPIFWGKKLNHCSWVFISVLSNCAGSISDGKERMSQRYLWCAPLLLPVFAFFREQATHVIIFHLPHVSGPQVLLPPRIIIWLALSKRLLLFLLLILQIKSQNYIS